MRALKSEPLLQELNVGSEPELILCPRILAVSNIGCDPLFLGPALPTKHSPLPNINLPYLESVFLIFRFEHRRFFTSPAFVMNIFVKGWPRYEGIRTFAAFGPLVWISRNSFLLRGVLHQSAILQRQLRESSEVAEGVY